jgi:hypothetical protein
MNPSGSDDAEFAADALVSFLEGACGRDMSRFKHVERGVLRVNMADVRAWWVSEGQTAVRQGCLCGPSPTTAPGVPPE